MMFPYSAMALQSWFSVSQPNRCFCKYMSMVLVHSISVVSWLISMAGILVSFLGFFCFVKATLRTLGPKHL